jgi:hypothetical protein
MFEIIDFDGHFADYTSKWVEDHRGEYKNLDAMEADIPKIYRQFLNTPAEWLDGVTPGAYFTQYEDPKDLVDWLVAYCEAGVSVPELLMEQIEAVGKPCEKRLVAVLKDENAGADVKMTAIGLLRNLNSVLPKMLYIQWQLDREANDELADSAIDSLAEMGTSVLQPMLEALPKANDNGQAALLDILVRHPGNEMVLKTTLKLFREHRESRALFAGYLAKLGDERALSELEKSARDPETGYVDFIEIRAAIEQLGGTAPERDYSGDPDYEILRGM